MKELDTVVLTRALPDAGLEVGDVGAVVHRHGEDVVEVEFISGEGDTVAVVTLPVSDLRPIQAREILHVRELSPS